MKVDENKGVVGSPVAQRKSIRLLTENFKSNNSFLWRQLTASGTSPNTLFLPPPLSPTLFPSVPSHGIRQIGFRDYFRVAAIRELSPVGLKSNAGGEHSHGSRVMHPNKLPPKSPCAQVSQF